MANAQLRPAYVTGFAQLRSAWATAGGATAVDLAAVAAAEALAAAALTHDVPLSGDATAEATAVGVITHGIPLASAGLSVPTADGAMSVSIPLSGSALAQALSAAGVTHAVPLAGAGLIEYMRPVSDIEATDWVPSSGTTLFSLLDEANADDTGYISGNSGSEVALLGLGAIAKPAGNNGHAIKIRGWAPGGTGYLNVYVYANYDEYLLGNPLRSAAIVFTGTPTTFTYPIGPAYVNTITDYSALILELRSFGTFATRVSQAYVQVTQSAVATATGDLSVAAEVLVDLAASATATPNSTGGLSLSIPLSGSAVAQALAAAGITHAVPMAGAGQTSHAVYSRPESDTALGSWVSATGGSLFSALDEAAANDTDYIYNTNNAFVWGVIKLSAMADPGVDTGHSLKYRAWKSEGANAWLFSYLHCGATVITQDIRELTSTTPTDYSFTITEAQAALITDYSNLRLETLVTGGVANVSQFAFAVDLPGAEATGEMTHDIPLTAVAERQYAAPIADISAAAGWTTTATSFFEALNDDDLDFVDSGDASGALSLQLAPISDPDISTGHAILIRVSAAEDGTIGSFQLWQGATSIRSGITTCNMAMTDKRLPLTAAQANLITDYSALRLELYSAASVSLRIYKAGLEVVKGATATATAAGELTQSVNLSGSAIAEAIASAALETVGSVDLSGNALAQAEADAALTHSVSLTGAAIASAVASAALAHRVSLSGAAISSAVSSAGLSHGIALTGAVVAEATALAGLSHGVKLGGTAVSATIANAGLAISKALAGKALAASTASAGLSINVSLSGAAVANAAAAALLTQSGQINLSSAAIAAATASGALLHAISLAGASVVIATASGDVKHDVPVYGQASSAASASGSLDVRITLSGAALVEALTAASLKKTASLAGSAIAEAGADSTITLDLNIDGNALAAAIARGSLTVSKLIYTASTLINRITREVRTIVTEDEGRVIRVVGQDRTLKLSIK